MALLSQVKPNNVKEALLDDGWILAMQEELDKFQKNDIWKLVSPPNDKSIIGTKWIFRNKLDENGKVMCNKERLEAICILLSFAAYHNMKLYQMNSDAFPYHVFKLKKTFYGLKSKHLMLVRKNLGKVDITLFFKNYDPCFIILHIYVYDIIFGATNDSFCEEISELMQKEFEMSMMEELKFILGLQIKQAKDGIYIHQTKHVKELPKKFNLEDC
ncbi:Copia protein, partial [Mucuna pruriens]